MKKYLSFFLLVAMAVVFTGCGEKTVVVKDITVANQSELEQSAYANDVATGGVTFTALVPWTAGVLDTSPVNGVKVPVLKAGFDGPSWVTLDRYDGPAGRFTLKITLETNYTGKDRSAEIVIRAGVTAVRVNVVQKGKTRTGEIPVVPVPVTSITLNESSLKLKTGESETLIATVLPENATVKTVVWSSSDTSVAEVDGKGSVTAVKNGEAVITATSTLFPQVKATCTVTVDGTDKPALPAGHLRAINGVDLIYNEDGYVIGKGTKFIYTDFYEIEGGNLGGGGMLKSIEGHDPDLYAPTKNEYFFEDGYLNQINYSTEKICKILFTWENGDIAHIRDENDYGVNLTELEYTDTEYNKGNLNVNMYLIYRGAGDGSLGPFYYVIFDKNLGESSKHLISKAIYSKENDPAYGWDHERSFRYVFNSAGYITEVYTTEKWANEDKPRNEELFCQFFYFR